MADAGEARFLEAMHRRVDDVLDACTRCGKCVAACPMVEPAGLDPAQGAAIAEGIIDLLAGGPGTPEAERWTQICTNSGKCIPACEDGVDPRFMVNMARIAAKAKLGEDAVRRAGAQYFSNLNRATRIVARLQMPPETMARLNPALRPAGGYEGTPDLVFYTGCNIVKTPHILLLALEVLDALGVTYEVMGGAATCCGIQHFKQGDGKTGGRIGYHTVERLSRPGAARVLSWCPSCQIQIGEFALPSYKESTGAAPFDLSPIAMFFAERLDDLRPLFRHPVPKRVALQERSAVPGIMVAVKTVLRAIPGLEVVELDVPVLSTQASHLSVLPKFKAELREREFRAAAEAGVTTFASIFHGCHRDLVMSQDKASFEVLNFMELIGESMGIHIPDLYKRLHALGDIDAVLADAADLIAANGLDPETVRDVVANDLFNRPLPPRGAASGQ